MGPESQTLTEEDWAAYPRSIMILWVGGGCRATGSPERAAHQVTTIVIARYSYIQVHTKYIQTIYTHTYRCTQYILTTHTYRCTQCRLTYTGAHNIHYPAILTILTHTCAHNIYTCRCTQYILTHTGSHNIYSHFQVTHTQTGAHNIYPHIKVHIIHTHTYMYTQYILTYGWFLQATAKLCSY